MKSLAAVLGSLLLSFLVLTILLQTGPVLATDGVEKTPHLIPRIENTISIDGALDEPAWAEALVMGVNTQVRPGDNTEAPVRTDMLLAFSDTHFYVAFRAFDPDPSQIYAHLCDHDNMWDDEWVVIGIDTYNDQRGGYEFACNPLGIQGDTASGVHGDGNSWDAIWDSAGQIFDWGYSVEMAIPFCAIRFQTEKSTQIWGVDAVRSYPRDVRYHLSLYPRDRDNNCYYCQMEKIIGFEGATPGRNIEIDPTISGIATQERENFPTGDFGDAQDDVNIGVTGRWGLTPNITAGAAINPDFSQVEADAFQLDVNQQYALYYEEKRPFFLESAGVFDNFYSRSIASPHWGAKLTGKAGANAFGALVARDEITNLIFAGSQFSRSTSLNLESTAMVASYQRDIGEQSTVNAFYNGREADHYHNRVAGVEADIWLSENTKIEIEGKRSDTRYPDELAADYDQPDGEFSDAMFATSIGNYTSGLDVYANYSISGEDFRSDLDYMPGVGYSHTEAGWGHTWRRGAGGWWNMLNFGSSYVYQENEDKSPRRRGGNFWFNYAGPKQSYGDLNGWYGRQTYLGTEFDTWNLSADAGAWPSGSVYLRGDAGYGEAMDYRNARTGRRLSLEPRIEFKMGRGLSVVLAHTFERFDIDEGRLYTANISYLRTIYQLSRRAFVRAILQYENSDETRLYSGENSESSSLATQFLVSYKINPQTVFFLGYSDGHYGDHDVKLTQAERTVFAKIGYAWVM
ncbi:MAG: carbohydrate binding family 9 domain-containing protein [Candidatus Eisenbacteria bacterium]|uniref:Carbohydrate binding family 9 domain-containing protein n=1 Tax=Eiseniibacteriota bacterium TaxID=2212470 RepID=A0A948W7W9_UNCEI|nr:carbohydrate binding family 9 domain-containing protein [Candidatus Eisenbacteria bacterium]MBU1949646.1 carbohydrate binding family 9 domain-containing protein [Candidatus Eisenbacteria bacterium]MBU2693039.1 carbohydrate binding family 9 domain-containing protein [Candidatus Eisenbacteria bacterium]